MAATESSKYVAGFLSGLAAGMLILASYQMYQMYQRSSQRHEYLCSGGAYCDLETKFSDIEREARQSEIDSFRACHALYVQGDSEDFEHFIERLPKGQTLRQCAIFKKSQQRVKGDGVTFSGSLQNTTLIGGDFIVEATHER